MWRRRGDGNSINPNTKLPQINKVSSSVFSDSDNIYPTSSMIRIDVETSPPNANIETATTRISSESTGYDSGTKNMTFGSLFYHWDTTGLNPASDYVVEVILTNSAGETVTDATLVITLASNPPLINKLVSTVDTSFPAQGLPVSIVRTYLLGSSLITAFGNKWTHNYLMQVLEMSDGLVRFRNVDGAATFFKPMGGGTYSAPRGDFRTLLKNTDGTFTLRNQSGTFFYFDTEGTLIRVEDRNGNILTLIYDDKGLLNTIVDSSGQRTTLAYDTNNRIISISDPIGRNIFYEYDSNGDLVTFTDIGGYRTTYGYDANHNLSNITDPAGRQTFFTTDDQERLATVSNAGGNNEVAFLYESPSSDQMTVTDALGNETILTYDVHGQVTGIVDAKGNITNVEYDSDGNPVQIVDANGKRTTMIYDDRGNVISATDAQGNTRDFEYEIKFNKLVSLTDAKGRSNAFSYDSQGNLTMISYPNGAAEIFVFDSFGNLIGKTDRKKQTITFEYDTLGQLVTKRFPDGTSDTFGYDIRGNLVAATDENGTIQFTYDDDDRLVQVIYPGGESVSYTYDAAGNRTKLVYPDGTVLNYEYDEVGRLARIKSGGSVVAEYEYDLLGRRTRRELQNGTFSTYAYDEIGNLKELINQRQSKVISRFAYTYDQLGNRLTMATLEGTTQYIYDEISQLIRVILPTGKVNSYNFDEEGNRVSVDEDGNTNLYSTNELNQYTDVGKDVYDYDANGNMIGKESGSGVTAYSYDFENRLVRVIRPSESVSYEYDPLGRRISRSTSNSITRYIYDVLDVIVEKDGNGTINAKYIHGASIDEVLVMWRGGNSFYYSHDGLGSVVNLTDSSAGIVNSFIYDEYGKTSGGSLGNPYLFTGREFDFEAGLYYYRARYYDPEVGRFITANPIKLLGGLNLYSFVKNNPINNIDPLGYGIIEWIKRSIRNWIILFSLPPDEFYEVVLRPLYEATFEALGNVMGSGMSLPPEAREAIRNNEDVLEAISRAMQEDLERARQSNLQLEKRIRRKWLSFLASIKRILNGDPSFIQSSKSQYTSNYENSAERLKINTKYGLTAKVDIPLDGSLVRANVPIFGLARGENFKEYHVEYGEGLDPENWKTIATSNTPQTKDVTPADLNDSLDITIYGNLATWDTGLTNYVYLPSHPKDHPVDLNGTYTIRLVVTGKDGRKVEDRVTVIAANVIPNAWGGIVRSKDDKAVLTVPEQAIMDSFRLITMQPTDDAPDNSISGRGLIGKVFEIREPGERFTKEAELRIVFSMGDLNGTDPNRLGIYGYNAEGKSWEYQRSIRREGENAIFTTLRKLHPYYALMTSETMTEGSALEPESVKENDLKKVSIYNVNGPYLVRNSFEHDLGEWSNRDNEVGAEVALDDTATFDGSKALKITNTNIGGNFAVNVITTSFDARDYPVVQFDYRIPKDVKTNFLVKVTGRWYEIGFTDDYKVLRDKRVNIANIGNINGIIADDQWHSANFNLYDMLRTRTGNTLVEEMIMADWDVGGFMKLQFGLNRQGATYYIDNFTVSRELYAGLRLDEDTILIDNFNKKKVTNDLGSQTYVFNDEKKKGLVHINFSDEDFLDQGNSLMLSYDVSQPESYAGYITSLPSLDLREYQSLRLYTKRTESNEGLLIGLRDAEGLERKVPLSTYLPNKVSEGWQKIEIPLVAFSNDLNWGKIINLSLSFEHGVHPKGTVAIDHIEISKGLEAFLVDSFENTESSNMVGGKHWTYASGNAAIGGQYAKGSPNGIYRISYGGNIGEIKAYASDLFSYSGWSTELGGIDCTQCGSVSFHIRGSEGDEKPNVYLDDRNFRWGVDIEKYAKVTTDWQEVTIPLQDFAEYGVDLTHLAALQVVFEWEAMSGTIYIDDIRFGTYKDR